MFYVLVCFTSTCDVEVALVHIVMAIIFLLIVQLCLHVIFFQLAAIQLIESLVRWIHGIENDPSLLCCMCCCMFSSARCMLLFCAGEGSTSIRSICLTLPAVSSCVSGWLERSCSTTPQRLLIRRKESPVTLGFLAFFMCLVISSNKASDLASLPQLIASASQRGNIYAMLRLCFFSIKENQLCPSATC